MPDATTKDRYRCMAVSLWLRGAIRVAGSGSRDGGAAHIAANSHTTTVCLDARHRRRLLLWRFLKGKEIDNNDPKSGCQNDEPASEPPQNLLIVLVTQELPQPIHGLHVLGVAWGTANVGLGKKLGGTSLGKIN